MENKESKNEILDFFIQGSDNLVNNVVKALLFGFIVGAFFYYWGRDFDFKTPYSMTKGIISGVVVAGGLFLKYNSKK